MNYVLFASFLLHPGPIKVCAYQWQTNDLLGFDATTLLKIEYAEYAEYVKYSEYAKYAEYAKPSKQSMPGSVVLSAMFVLTSLKSY